MVTYQGVALNLSPTKYYNLGSKRFITNPENHVDLIPIDLELELNSKTKIIGTQQQLTEFYQENKIQNNLNLHINKIII